jgi:Uncharacterized protein conserved in bacteria
MSAPVDGASPTEKASENPLRGKRAVVVSGGSRYADPWHPFAVTSAALAEILTGLGLDVVVDDGPDTRLADLDDVDLLVVNIGNPGQSTSPAARVADGAARAGILAYRERGGPLLAMHSSITSLIAMPEWEEVLGAVWVRGVSMHPPIGRSHIRVYPGRHTIVHGQQDFELDDERYSLLRVGRKTIALASHELDGERHPLLWAHERDDARVVVDLLGHDARSYESAEHRALIARSARWLLGDL